MVNFSHESQRRLLANGPVGILGLIAKRLYQVVDRLTEIERKIERRGEGVLIEVAYFSCGSL